MVAVVVEIGCEPHKVFPCWVILLLHPHHMGWDLVFMVPTIPIASLHCLRCPLPFRFFPFHILMPHRIWYRYRVPRV